jgi:hypothetical protein
MASVRLYFKKELRVDHLNASQSIMLRLGTVGVAAVKNRVTAGLGPNDSPARPLNKNYAIAKSRLGLGNRRTLSFTGNLLRNFTVRTVSDKQAKASLTSRKERIKAAVNTRLEPWIVFSPKNRAAVMNAARQIFPEMTKRLLVEKSLTRK